MGTGRVGTFITLRSPSSPTSSLQDPVLAIHGVEIPPITSRISKPNSAPWITRTSLVMTEFLINQWQRTVRKNRKLKYGYSLPL